MSKKKYHRKRQRQFPVIPMVLGLLLIAFGILVMVSPKSSGSTISSSSVVPMPVNYAAPQLSLQNINGQTESLTDYRADIVLVNNWATWCPPCQAEMPTLAAYYREHRAESFTIIAIAAGDSPEAVSEFAQLYNLEFPVWLDPNTAALQAFGNGNLPNSYVIDRSGTVRYAWTGEIDKAMLEKYVTPLLAEH
jgi:peroxiredoxin